MSNQSNQMVKPALGNGQFAPGNGGHNLRHTSPQTRYIRKLQLAMDLAIDDLGKRVQTDGATAISLLIADALQADVVGTLHKLQFMMPKNINVDVQVTKDFNELSDAELEALIAERRAIAVSKETALIEQVPQVTTQEIQDTECVEIVSNKDEQ